MRFDAAAKRVDGAAWFQLSGAAAIITSVTSASVIESGSLLAGMLWVGFAVSSLAAASVVQHCLTTHHQSAQVPQLGVFLGTAGVFGQLWRSVVTAPTPATVVSLLVVSAGLLWLINGIDHRLRQPSASAKKEPANR